MIIKQTSFVKRHLSALALLLAAASLATSSAVLAQDSPARPSTPPATDKMGMGSAGGGMMGMGSDGNGAMSGMKAMKCCGQGGMGRAGHGADERQDEKK
ncbi:hypothetical protein [Bradyrhizobium sp. Cp5.3]|uniref:hypothetical protein n=1 Tax=Bradyrhizobium sp. Cp5.3 TaxID=443598 RepID=UPI0004188F69|nr:hypothetical protein [Bradyrhizobium sp. Cp5.3]